MPEAIVAEKTVVVHDDNLNIDRVIQGGQPVPPDLVDAYKDAGGKNAATTDAPTEADTDAATTDAPTEADTDAAATDDGAEVRNWAADTKAVLEDEAASRGLEVTGTGKDGAVVKDDLVAALQAADNE